MDCLHRTVESILGPPFVGLRKTGMEDTTSNGNMVDGSQLEVGVSITFITQPVGVQGAVIVEGAAGGYG